MNRTRHPILRIRARRAREAALLAILLVPLSCGTAPRDDQAVVAMALARPEPQDIPPSEDAAEPTWKRHVRIFGPILLNPSPDIDADTRRAAALELHALGRTGVVEAISVLAHGLESGQDPVIEAVVDVLLDDPDPPAALFDSALSALPTGNERLDARLGVVLARYGPSGLEGVGALATDPAGDPSERLAAVRALAWFRSRDAAERLVAMLTDPNSSPEMLGASCASLGELTGLGYGDDAAQWLAWWKNAGRLPSEGWQRLMMQTLAERIASLERDIQTQQDQNTLTEQKLLEVYGELYPALTVEEQLRRLPMLLEDELPRLRGFAVGRVARLLRDSVRIPTDVQDRLAERLGDEQADVRRQAVQLLDELDYPQLAEGIAARLDGEADPAVVEAYITVLQKRPVMSALAPLGRRLPQPGLGDLAAQSLWAQVTTLEIGDDGRHLVTDALATGLEHRALTPPVARLVAYFAGVEDTDVETLLDDADPAMRRAVAEGLAARGRLSPLRGDRASDEAIYPILLDTIARDARELSEAQDVILLAPPTARLQQTWADAVRLATVRLGPADLLEVDTELSGLPHAPLALRRDVLQQAWATLGEDADDERRVVIVARLAPMELALGEAREAYQLISSLDEAAITPPLRTLRFDAALMAGAYEAAARLQSDPAAWIGVFVTLVAERPDVAARLREEIRARFEGALEDDLRIQFEAASRRLGGEPDNDASTPPTP